MLMLKGVCETVEATHPRLERVSFTGSITSKGS